MGIVRGLTVVAVVCSIVMPARAITEEEERAKAHFLAGQSYYDQASYTDALREFNEAYRISKKPALLYNIARCYEGLDQPADAVKMLERYLQEDPETPDRTSVETRIANLKERAAARLHRQPEEPTEPSRPPAATTTAAASAPASTSAPPRKRVWTWVVGGIGVAALAAALGTGVASQLDYNDLSNKCMANVCSPSEQHNLDNGKKLALATDVLWPIGAAAVATSVVLFFVEGRQAKTHASRILPLVGPSQGGLAVAHDF
jgi:tetratricopeptide (TPR) repeat protein